MNDLKLSVEEVIASDVLVVGSGAAGLRAAISAAEHPVDVTLVSKGPIPGGSTPMSSGFIEAVTLSNDNSDLHFKDTVVGGEFLNNQKLVRILANEGRRAILDLEMFGCVFERVSPNVYMTHKMGGFSIGRGAQNMNAFEISNVLTEQARSRRVSFFENVMITSLIKSGSGMAGATALDIKSGDFLLFKAKSVVLASGGLGQLYKRNTVARTSTGECFVMAYQLGVPLVDIEIPQPLPLSFVYPESFNGLTFSPADYYGPKVKILNRLGERFMERYDPENLEHTTYSKLARACFIEIMEGRGTEHGGVIVDATENDRADRENFRTRFSRRWRKIRDAYGEPAANWEVPFESAPTMWAGTGGLQITENCETKIPRLLAAGEIAGGIHGANRMSGNSLTDTLVFGKRAGTAAAVHALRAGRSKPDEKLVLKERRRVYSFVERREGLSPIATKKELQQLMWDKLGIVRSEASVREALRRILQMKKAAPSIATANKSTTWNTELVEAIEVSYMIQLAELIAKASLIRRESRGGYYRSDYPRRDDAQWLKNIYCRVGETPRFWSQPVQLTELKPYTGPDVFE